LLVAKKPGRKGEKNFFKKKAGGKKVRKGLTSSMKRGVSEKEKRKRHGKEKPCVQESAPRKGTRSVDVGTKEWFVAVVRRGGSTLGRAEGTEQVISKVCKKGGEQGAGFEWGH